jgi:hypothetical protein
MPNAPYIVFGFDVDRADPNCDAIIASAQSTLPPIVGIGSLGVASVFLVEVPPSHADEAFEQIAHALWTVDQDNGRSLRWFVQLCGTADFAGG